MHLARACSSQGQRRRSSRQGSLGYVRLPAPRTEAEVAAQAEIVQKAIKQNKNTLLVLKQASEPGEGGRCIPERVSCARDLRVYANHSSAPFSYTRGACALRRRTRTCLWRLRNVAAARHCRRGAALTACGSLTLAFQHTARELQVAEQAARVCFSRSAAACSRHRCRQGPACGPASPPRCCAGQGEVRGGWRARDRAPGAPGARAAAAVRQGGQGALTVDR
jgi:hypothetical protein